MTDRLAPAATILATLVLGITRLTAPERALVHARSR